MIQLRDQLVIELPRLQVQELSVSVSVSISPSSVTGNVVPAQKKRPRPAKQQVRGAEVDLAQSR
ncbi:hypothetical protein ACFZAV_40940 [Streptomyces sp. NPDC008343]|uniref:hypothetical protein n=1 Tax=Streptomyces sp. NPDC008343 TaxID=3364828 RepID=UPI0036E133C7